MNTRRVGAIVLVLLALSIAALMLFDFHATQGETRAQSQVATFRSGPSSNGDQPPPASRDLAVHVAGDSDLASELREELEAGLAGSASFESIQRLQSPDELSEPPALLVELPRREVIWTPVYSTADVTVQFAYGSDGDLSWRNDEVVAMSNDGGWLLRAKGEITLSDSARGLMSRRAYYGRVAGAITDELIKRLEAALAVPPGQVAVPR